MWASASSMPRDLLDGDDVGAELEAEVGVGRRLDPGRRACASPRRRASRRPPSSAPPTQASSAAPARGVPEQRLRRVAGRRVGGLAVDGQLGGHRRIGAARGRRGDRRRRRAPSPGCRSLPWIWRTNSDEPRATITSTRPCRPSTAVTSSRPSSSTAARGSIPASSSTRWMTAVSARFVASASRPPLSRTALPLFQARPTICTSASGRDSNTTPSRPSGQLTRSSTSPSSSSRRSVARPTRSGMAASCSSPSQTPSSLPASSPRRLTSGEATLFGLGARRDPRRWPRRPRRARAGSRSASASARSSAERRSGAEARQLAAGRLGRQAVARIAVVSSAVRRRRSCCFIRLLPSPGCRA